MFLILSPAPPAAPQLYRRREAEPGAAASTALCYSPPLHSETCRDRGCAECHSGAGWGPCRAGRLAPSRLISVQCGSPAVRAALRSCALTAALTHTPGGGAMAAPQPIAARPTPYTCFWTQSGWRGEGGGESHRWTHVQARNDIVSLRISIPCVDFTSDHVTRRCVLGPVLTFVSSEWTGYVGSTF